MKPFYTIAVPHKDILEGEKIFAPDLCDVYCRRGPAEYKEAKLFFSKTYLSQGVQKLLKIVQSRLKGKMGDPVIKIQTPFGGGKTNALIALFHKAAEWKAKTVVATGDVFAPGIPLWGLIEKQLTGKDVKFINRLAPGKEAIRKMLSKDQPLLILLDEILKYAKQATAIRVGSGNLAAQTVAFVRELAKAVRALDKVCLVMALPSSSKYYHSNKGIEKLRQKLLKIAGRVEKIYGPAEEKEITQIINKRLFRKINEKKAKAVIDEFVARAEKEGILPSGMRPGQYRDRFFSSYPFRPEVMDVLCQRWRRRPAFQSTRGLLRLLSLAVYSLQDSSLPYISLADFSQVNQKLRQELIKYTGLEHNERIAAHIESLILPEEKACHRIARVL